MRCPDCNKFVGNDEQEPEVEEPEVSEDGHVTVEVRIVNACADCGAELTEATLTLEGDVAVPEAHQNAGDPDGKAAEVEHELTAEVVSSERTSRQGYFKQGVFVPKGGRYGKTFYGASVEVKVTCSCGAWEESLTLEDEVQASGMDSLV